MLTLRQFRYFDALARAGHFGRAAEECAVTQPALSMQIQEMERELGVTLVERRRDGVVLTPEGEAIRERVRSVLGEVEGIAGFANGQDGLSGSLRLGVIPTIGPYLLPDLLPALARDYPAVKLNIRETRTQKLLEELQQGRLDLVIAALPLAGVDIAAEPLFDDRFFLVTPMDRPPPPASALPEYIASEQLLLLEEGHCLRDQALRHCDAAGIRFGEIYGTSNITTLIQMVANGLGITLAPELSLETEISRTRVRLSRFGEPEPFRTVALAWRRTAPRAAHYSAIGGTIRTLVADRAARLAAVREGAPFTRT